MRRFWGLVSVSALALCSVFVNTATGFAAALGTNGQQAAYSPSCYSNWAHSQGYNQNSKYTYRWFLVWAATPEGGCFAPLSYDYGYWWKGTVKTDGYWQYNSQFTGTTYTYFPTCCPTSNWVVVTMP